MIDMRAVNADAKSYQLRTSEKCLATAERENKPKYLDSCLQQRQHFSPSEELVYSLLGMETEATLKRLVSRLPTKWKQPYSRTCGYVQSRVAITLIRATHCCIRGSQMPAIQISVQRPQWGNGAGLSAYTVDKTRKKRKNS